MRKIFAAILTITMLTGLFSACGKQNSPEVPSTTERIVATTESSTEATTNTASSTYDLTHTDIIAALNEQFAQSEFGAISEIKETSDSDGGTLYSFTFAGGLAICNIHEINGKVHYIITFVAIADLYNKLSSISQEEQLSYGLMLCAFPIHLINFPEENTNYLPMLLLQEATSKDSTITGTYVDHNWEYTLRCSDVLMSISATTLQIENTSPTPDSNVNYSDSAGTSDTSDSSSNATTSTKPRICAQCGKSEPDVEIPSTSDICFGCNYDNQVETKLYCANCGEDCTFRGLYNGLCDDCLRLSVDINTGISATEPPATQPPAGCRHNYTAATCTTPKTCILCGKTEGFAMSHYYSSATCTTPETCIICGAVRGIAAGHNYAEATCTSPITCMICGMTTGNAAGHNYTSATCTAPKTCTICGSTTGNATGHNYTAATCTDPMTCTLCGATRGAGTGHAWIAITEIVYHEEQGHYEDVQVAKKIQKYRCWLCSYADPTFSALSAYYAHFDKEHCDEANSSFFRERYETVEDWTYVYETKWFVDTPAYSEKVVTGYKCSACGEEK